MAKYSFQVRKHIKDDMYKTESIDVELSDSEYKSIKSDDGKYSKGSALISSKLGETVQAVGLPREVMSLNKKEDSNKNKKSDSTKKSSLWKPFWAFPFKLIWRLIKFIFSSLF